MIMNYFKTSFRSLWRNKNFTFINIAGLAVGITACLLIFLVIRFETHDWLQQYDYRITISPLVFVIAGIAAIVITIITISFQAIKAAITNPVKSLRTE